MCTLNKPPLPNYSVTTVRPLPFCIFDKNITEEAEQITKEHTKQVADFNKQLNEYEQNNTNLL